MMDQVNERVRIRTRIDRGLHEQTKAVITRHVPIWGRDRPLLGIERHPWLASVPFPDAKQLVYVNTWPEALTAALRLDWSDASGWEVVGWRRWYRGRRGPVWALFWRCPLCKTDNETVSPEAHLRIFHAPRVHHMPPVPYTDTTTEGEDDDL